MINSFINEVKNRGLARTNRYEVVIIFPTAPETVRVANLFCDAVTLPGANISTTPMKTFGETREMPYEKIYDPVTMSFYVDSDLEIKKAFEEWMEMIYNSKTRTLGYYQDYIRPVEIYVKGVDDSAPYKITLYEAYPKTLNSIQLDANGKEVMKLTLTMQYKYWVSSATNQFPTPQLGTASANAWNNNTQDPMGVYTGEGYNFYEQGWPTDTFDPPMSTFSETTP